MLWVRFVPDPCIVRSWSVYGVGIRFVRGPRSVLWRVVSNDRLQAPGQSPYLPSTSLVNSRALDKPGEKGARTGDKGQRAGVWDDLRPRYFIWSSLALPVRVAC